jgi:glutamate racemase
MDPAVKPAVGSTQSGVIGILDTGATFQSRRFASVVKRFARGADIQVAACPDWVTLVEDGLLDGPEVELAVRSRLEPILAAGADTLVLGCTHCPFLVDVISRVAGSSVRVVDPGDAVARQVGRVHRGGDGSGSFRLATTGDASLLTRQAGLLVPELALPPALAFAI